jgi:hypothetical protein
MDAFVVGENRATEHQSNRQQATGNRQQATGNKQPGTKRPGDDISARVVHIGAATGMIAESLPRI